MGRANSTRAPEQAEKRRGTGKASTAGKTQAPEPAEGGTGKASTAGRTQTPEPAGRVMGRANSTRAPEQAEKRRGTGKASTAGRARAPEPAEGGTGKASTAGKTQAPEQAEKRRGTGKASTAGSTRAPEPAEGGTGKASTAGRTQTPEPAGRVMGRANSTRTPEQAEKRRGTGKASTAGKTQTPWPEGTKARRRAGGDAEDRAQSPILKDNEFNIMLKISSLPRVQCNELECSERDVYSVKLKRESNSRDLNIFLSENENLSSSKMLSELKEVMEKIIAKQKTWCLSFPHIEKEMLNNHGKLKTCCELNGPKCCRKACLRLLQYLLQKLQHKNERNQKLVKFSSYHVKTAYFHACVSRPDDTNWKLEDLDNCFEILVNDFVNHLQIKELLHFFIPSMNLFGLFDQSSLTFLSDEIEYQRNNGFPIFIP
uniref:Uncharacterized protein LOC117358224 isoform X2 n=1 Tax=Geotrypetes seraphini TaxID=260995 RepID=A0A6P8QIW3_GEOSA|nr:uncharacterized protein LOC117358224 isoform X2 [Geotrypetes seraphini]